MSKPDLQFGFSRRELGQLLGSGAAAATIAEPVTARSNPGKQIVEVPARPEAFKLNASAAAVIVVDMQNDFGSKGGAFDLAGIDIRGIQAVVPRILGVLGAARVARLPVIYLKMGFAPDLSDAGGRDAPNFLKHKSLGIGRTVTAPDGRPSRLFVRGTWNNDVVDQLKPAKGDIVVNKTRFSGFYKTDLDAILKRMGARELIVTGCTTSVCVDSTVRDAMFRDYRCLLLEDCMAEPIGENLPRSNHEASLLTTQILFGWVSSSEQLIDALGRNARTG